MTGALAFARGHAVPPTFGVLARSLPHHARHSGAASPGRLRSTRASSRAEGLRTPGTGPARSPEAGQPEGPPAGPDRRSNGSSGEAGRATGGIPGSVRRTGSTAGSGQGRACSPVRNGTHGGAGSRASGHTAPPPWRLLTSSRRRARHPGTLEIRTGGSEARRGAPCPRGRGRATPLLDRGSPLVSLVPREFRHVESGPGSCRKRIAVHGRTPTQHARGRGEPDTGKRAAPREETP